MSIILPPAPAAAPYSLVAPPPLKPAINGLGIASLSVGVVGFLFAFLPFIGLFGGFLGFVGVILGVVALVLKGKARGFAAAGTAVSTLVLIVSIFMATIYTIAAVEAFNDAMPGRPIIVAPNAEDATGLGSPESPAPLGTTILVDNPIGPAWEVTPGPTNLNVTDQVMAASPTNAEPRPGRQYVSLAVKVKNVGPESASPMELKFVFVAADGHSYNGSFVDMDGQLGDLPDVDVGGEVSGSVIMELHSTAVEKGTWAVSYYFGDPFFFAAV